MSPSDVWARSVCATDMWGQVNGQYGLGPNWALVGLGWACLGRAGPDTWRAVALPRRSRGLLLGCGPQAWSTVDASSRSMDLRQGPWWTKSISLLSLCGSRAPSAWACGRRGEVFPCFLPRRCSCRRRAHGEPPWWRWCPIGEGKSFPGPRRLCQWGQGGGQSFPKVPATASGGSSSIGVREWRGDAA